MRIYRIGGGRAANLQLKPAEILLQPPGISILLGATPAAIFNQIREAFPGATRLHESARVLGVTTEIAIRSVGFDVYPDPTRRLPNHHRLIHPDGVDGFSVANLVRLAEVFIDIPAGE